METQQNEQELLHSVALQTSQSIMHLRQRAEQQLREAKEALEAKTEELAHSLAVTRATLEATTDGILVVDEQGRVTDFNEQFVRIWVIPRETLATGERGPLLKIAVTVIQNPEQFLARTDEIYEKSPAESVDRLEFLDGRIFERYSKLQRVGERVLGRVWSYRDITERARAEETLRDEARLLELLNKTGAAIAAQLDLQNVVQIVTDAATELTGAKFGAFFYSRLGESGETTMLYTLSGAPREAFEHFDYPRTAGLFAETFRGKGPIRSDDISQDARYAELAQNAGLATNALPVRSYLAMPVISSSGEVIGGLFFGHPAPAVFTERADRFVIGVAAQAAIAIDNARLYEAAQKEIAERRRAEAERELLLVSEKEARERAERETRMKDEFLATLSHELRTPLNAILGWANILRSSSSAEDIAEGVEVIERNARAQAAIIEDLLDMSRIISGKVRLEVRRMDLLAIIKTAIESVSPMAAAKGIAIASTLDEGAEWISGDPARVQQILWNLLTNALKFTPKGGSVEIAVERVESNIAIRVSDTGVGIAPDFLPHVFDRFRQADASTTRHHGGLGLGLAIVKNLVELHGGSVSAKSAGTNQGATFTIILPIVVAFDPSIEQTATTTASATEMPTNRADLTGLRVLVVDDEPDAREMVKRILSDRGAAVETAASSAEALHALPLVRPDVFITDIGMPDEDGYAVIRKVRELSPSAGGAVPAIALTAFARAEDRTRALTSGFQKHLSKPVDPAELVSIVAHLAGRASHAEAHPEFDYE